jgi:hypothetical protein
MDTKSRSKQYLEALINLHTELVVFGGAPPQDGSMPNQVFCLDLVMWVGKEKEILSDSSPSPQASPCFCVLKDGKSCVLFGGVAHSKEMGGLEGCSDLWTL